MAKQSKTVIPPAMGGKTKPPKISTGITKPGKIKPPPTIVIRKLK